jgi:hypothetical protein
MLPMLMPPLGVIPAKAGVTIEDVLKCWLAARLK